MAIQHFSIIGLTTGLESIRLNDENPYEGDRHGCFALYKGVKSYDTLACDDEIISFCAYVTDWDQLIVFVPDDKVTEVATLCVSEGVDYKYDHREDYVVFHVFYEEQLERKLVSMLREEYGKSSDDVQYQKTEAAVGEEDDEIAANAEATAETAADAKTPDGADWDLDLDEFFSMLGVEYGKTSDDVHHQETEAAVDTEDDEEEDENAVNAEATAEAAVADSKAPGGADWHLDLGDLSDFK